MRDRNRLETMIKGVREIEQGVNDNVALIEMGEEEGDMAIVKEAEKALDALNVNAQKKQLESLLSGEADNNSAYLQINAGAGGTEAQDWAEIVLRMYVRWAEQRGFKVETLEQSYGEEAGIKSATIEITGNQAYGWLKTETGVHRLVRISPYDSNARRHTSFASVSVTPVVDDNIEIEILDKDLKTDTYRSSGAGGQHVNKTDSAVRITHLPTGIIVACQMGRSQHQNRAEAMKMLKAKLYEIELRKREDAIQQSHDQKTDIAFGHQIRSYVLHPYQMVKDLRTEVETSDTQGVLNGDLDRFLEASLAKAVGGVEDRQ
jgi:peptide chain release factor 2